MSWLWRPVAAGIGWGDIALASLLSAFAVVIVSGALPATMTSNPHGSVLAAAAMLTMTAPVAWERRAPLAAAAVVAAGTAGNELLIGPMVRCGPALPAIMVIAFFAGTRLDQARLAIAAACCLAAMTLEAIYDPKLGPGFLVAGVPAVAGACGAGWVVRSRGLAADRARVAADLNDFVLDRIAAIADVATGGRDLVAADPAAARQALAVVESSGRATLAQMREVVGNLRARDRRSGRSGHVLA